MRHVASALAALLLAGCVVPQREAPRGAPIDTQSLGLGVRPTPPPPPTGWWTAFGDPQLDALMQEALSRSPTLAQALAHMRLAQSGVQADIAARRPRIAIDADETRQRLSEHYYIPPPFAGDTMWIGQATANLRWSIDFWGRQAALIRAARSQALASELDVASARLAITGAVGQAYVELYRAAELRDIASQAEAQRERVLELTRRRTAAGLGSEIEVRVAESAVPQARLLRLQAEAAHEVAMHRLAALVGAGADRYAQIVRPRLALDAALPLPDRLPADLLARRPDVLAARARVEAAAAGRAAAHAAFFPDISLTALVGSQAIGLDQLAERGSRIYGAGPALHLPIFDAGRLRAAYAGATAELDAATASYNGIVLDAVREASDQLTLEASFTRQAKEAAAMLQAASRAYALASDRHAAGLTTQIVLLDADARVLDARRSLLAAQSSRLLSRMNLLLVLGGSFDPAAPSATADAGARR